MSTTKWALDASHSEVSFKIRHMMVSNVTGQFKTFTAEVETEGDDMATAKVKFSADVDSIHTNNDQRDAHLKNADFFDAGNHPQIIFVSDKLEKTGIDEYKAHGMLTMRGTTKPEVLNVEFGGIMQDPWGNTRTGFTISGKINRMDYGVSLNSVTETGGVLLGEHVNISANAEFVKTA